MLPLNKVTRFTVLVFALSAPLWAFGAMHESQILPGLPLSALMIVAPATAAMILTGTSEGWRAALLFLGRIADVRRATMPAHVAAALLMPILTLTAWGWMRMDGVTMPDPEITLAQTIGLFAGFWLTGAAEELGWSGYQTQPARALWGFLGAAIVIGLIWALWHLVPLLQAGRNWTWIAWWSVGTVAARVVTLAMYQWSNESVFSVSALHAAQNTAWQLFPQSGSHFDPSYAAPVFVAGALFCSGIVLAHGRQRQ